MDKEFYAQVAAVGEIQRRKSGIRTRAYLVAFSISFPVCFGLWVLLIAAGIPTPVILPIATGMGVSGAVAETRARKRVQRVVEDVSKETGISVKQLRRDANAAGL